MSYRELPVRLSRKAMQDFIDILQYTGEQWGPLQLEVYRDKLNEALLVIGRTPHIGRTRNDMPSLYRAYLVGSHVVIYRNEDQDIGVVRILHQRMSPLQHLP